MIEEKVALVTGGSRGIGRAICLELARAGYALVIGYNENLGAAEKTRELVEDIGTPVDRRVYDGAVRAHRYACQ